MGYGSIGRQFPAWGSVVRNWRINRRSCKRRVQPISSDSAGRIKLHYSYVYEVF